MELDSFVIPSPKKTGREAASIVGKLKMHHGKLISAGVKVLLGLGIFGILDYQVLGGSSHLESDY